MTLEEYLLELRKFILDHPEAAQTPVKSYDHVGDLTPHVTVELCSTYVFIGGE